MMKDITVIINRIDALLSAGDSSVIVGIDGGSCTGKSTIAARLAGHYGCSAFHADDYFLRREQRTPQRLAEPGGNMDRERLAIEVLEPLSAGRGVVTRRFDCASMTLCEPVGYEYTRLNIVEGAYCLHPELRQYYDLTVFVTESMAVRLERLRSREEEPELFLTRWIPMEDRYFGYFKIRENADIVL